MPGYSFTLVVEGEVEAKLDDLFEAGCGDATFGSIDGVHYATFDREAETLAEATSSAIAGVESVGGLRVLDVEVPVMPGFYPPDACGNGSVRGDPRK